MTLPKIESNYIYKYNTIYNAYTNSNCKTGIYCIKNTINNKMYIGSSLNIFIRWKEGHIKPLLDNKHDNVRLQRAVNKHKIDNFDFIILEEFFFPKHYNNSIKQNYILSREQYYLDKLNKEDSYNLVMSVTDCAVKWTPERREFMIKI